MPRGDLHASARARHWLSPPPAPAFFTVPLSSASGPGAIGLILVATGLFTVGDAIVKYLSADWPVPQIVLLRSLFCLPLLLLARPRAEPILPASTFHPLNLLRAMFEIGVTFGYFLGAAMLPLSDAVTILFVSPLLLTAFAATVLSEKVGWRRWAGVGIGFFGVVIVMRPGTSAFTMAALLPLLAACFITGRDLVVRWLPTTISNRGVVLASTLALLLASLAVAPFSWKPVTFPLLVGTAAGACTVTSAFLCYVRATRIAEVSFIQPFRYAALPYAFALGWLIWGDLPDRWSLLGSGIILGSGLFVVHREQQPGWRPARTRR